MKCVHLLLFLTNYYDDNDDEDRWYVLSFVPEWSQVRRTWACDCSPFKTCLINKYIYGSGGGGGNCGGIMEPTNSFDNTRRW